MKSAGVDRRLPVLQGGVSCVVVGEPQKVLR